MSHGASTRWNSSSSPRSRARIAGIFYLLTFVAGALAAFAGNLPATYSNLANLIATVSYVAVVLIFYYLFEPAGRSIARLAVFFGLAGCVVSILKIYNLALLPLNALVLFGCYCLLIGGLILKSNFLPKILGVLMALGGLGWLTFLSPSLAHALSPYNLAPGMLGEGALTLWLLVIGVDPHRWQKQADAGESRSTA